MTDPALQPIVERLRVAGDDEAADALVMLDVEAAEAPVPVVAPVQAVPVEVTAPATHHTRLEAALQDIPRPVTAEAALSIARGVLPRQQFGQFEKWMAANGPMLLARLNA